VNSFTVIAVIRIDKPKTFTATAVSCYNFFTTITLAVIVSGQIPHPAGPVPPVGLGVTPGSPPAMRPGLCVLTPLMRLDTLAAQIPMNRHSTNAMPLGNCFKGITAQVFFDPAVNQFIADLTLGRRWAH
jgi:hypothetical protein